MAFQKGVSGNRNGRPKGAGNKITTELRDKISNFLELEFGSIQKDFKKLQPRDRLKFYSDLLVYAVPKLQSTSLDVDFEKLSDEDLDKIISKLTSQE
jgi:hypothetical protein